MNSIKNFTVLLFVSCSLSTFAQVKLNGVTLPATLSGEKTNLVLNGGGIRTKFFFKVYVGGLYLEQKNKSAESIIAADKPMAIRIQVTSGMLNSDNMSEAIQEGFGKSLAGKTAPLQTKIDAFITTFKKDAIKENDVYDIYYVPAEGVKAYKNGALQTTITGLDFKKALFGIWLSSDPVDDDLKEGLMGN